jgi:hypothetical protein
MTSPTPPGGDLDTIVSRTRHLLLDFDGPICSIFAGLPAATVADRLRKLFSYHTQLPDDIARTPTRWRYSPTPPPPARTWPPASRQR